MEMLIYLKSLARYLSQSPEHIREELARELRERLHRKEVVETNDSDAIHYKGAMHVVERSGKLGKLIVADPDAPASLLDRLANSNDRHILERIAEHPRVGEFTLSRLSNSIHPEVRMAVAENPCTPYEVLKNLARDEHPDVRYRLAESPHVCRTILAILEHDENPYVSDRAQRTLEK